VAATAQNSATGQAAGSTPAAYDPGKNEVNANASSGTNAKPVFSPQGPSTTVSASASEGAAANGVGAPGATGTTQGQSSVAQANPQNSQQNSSAGAEAKATPHEEGATDAKKRRLRHREGQGLRIFGRGGGRSAR